MICAGRQALGEKVVSFVQGLRPLSLYQFYFLEHMKSFRGILLYTGYVAKVEATDAPT